MRRPHNLNPVVLAMFTWHSLSDGVQVTSNGVEVGKFESSPDTASGYTAFVLRDDAVKTLTLTTSSLGATEWISILEVSAT